MSGFLNKLTSIAESAAKMGQPDPISVVAQAKVQTDANPAAAIALLQPLSVSSPENPEVWVALADAYSANQQRDEAIDAYSKLTTLKPGEAEPYLSLGTEYLNAEKYPEAERFLMRGLALAETQNWVDLFNAALSLYRQGNEAAAASFCKKSLAIEPDKDTYLLMADCLFDTMQFDGAADNYRNATLVAEPDPLAFAGLGRSLEYLERYEEAVAALRSALDRGIDDPEIYASLARCYENLGEDDQAQQAAAKYQELSGKDAS